MPLWLDLLRTPMAAPETDRLRRMRRTWQILCLACAVSVALISPLVALLGRGASLSVGSLLAMTAVYTALYAIRKNRADDAYLDAKSSSLPEMMAACRASCRSVSSAHPAAASPGGDIAISAWSASDAGAAFGAPDCSSGHGGPCD